MTGACWAGYRHTTDAEVCDTCKSDTVDYVIKDAPPLYTPHTVQSTILMGFYGENVQE